MFKLFIKHAILDNALDALFSSITRNFKSDNSASLIDEQVCVRVSDKGMDMYAIDHVIYGTLKGINTYPFPYYELVLDYISPDEKFDNYCYTTLCLETKYILEIKKSSFNW